VLERVGATDGVGGIFVPQPRLHLGAGARLLDVDQLPDVLLAGGAVLQAHEPVGTLLFGEHQLLVGRVGALLGRLQEGVRFTDGRFLRRAGFVAPAGFVLHVHGGFVVDGSLVLHGGFLVEGGLVGVAGRGGLRLAGVLAMLGLERGAEGVPPAEQRRAAAHMLSPLQEGRLLPLREENGVVGVGGEGL